jgi:4-amino-4-deoxy-L-arabinose transferase-like glycosyltransferase
MKKTIALILLVFLCELFLRAYQIDQKNPFGYDQVNNAWAAKNLIINHEFPLVGMAAKGNSGIFIGPFYYYLVALFYWLYDLNPFASGIIAVFTSIFTFWTIYFVTKKLFNVRVALIAIILNTFLMSGISFDRIQWPVNFIPGISLLIFYFLYRITANRDVKKIIPLAIILGLSFSVHFTSIFFPVIIFLSLPLFPRSKEMLKYTLLSLPFFLVYLIPNAIYQLGDKSANSNFVSYLNTYYHGFHLRRVLQLAGDGLIQFNSYAIWDKLTSFKFIAVPLFFLLFLYKSIDRRKLVFCYLISLWFMVPWLIFATYRGEISDYYFSINRFVALFIISYFIYRIWNIKNILPKILVIILFAYLIVVNFGKFISYKDNASLVKKEEEVLKKIKIGEEIKFQQGVPESYIYYYLKRQQTKGE